MRLAKHGDDNLTVSLNRSEARDISLMLSETGDWLDNLIPEDLGINSKEFRRASNRLNKLMNALDQFAEG